MLSTFEAIKAALCFVNGYVDLVKLEEVVIEAEVAKPGLQSAVAAIKANEAIIFHDALARMAADKLLGLLVAAQGLG